MLAHWHEAADQVAEDPPHRGTSAPRLARVALALDVQAVRRLCGPAEEDSHQAGVLDHRRRLPARAAHATWPRITCVVSDERAERSLFFARGGGDAREGGGRAGVAAGGAQTMDGYTPLRQPGAACSSTMTTPASNTPPTAPSAAVQGERASEREKAPGDEAVPVIDLIDEQKSRKRGRRSNVTEERAADSPVRHARCRPSRSGQPTSAPAPPHSTPASLTAVALLYLLGLVYCPVRDDGNRWAYALQHGCRSTPPRRMGRNRWTLATRSAIPDPSDAELNAQQELRNVVANASGNEEIRIGAEYDFDSSPLAYTAVSGSGKSLRDLSEERCPLGLSKRGRHVLTFHVVCDHRRDSLVLPRTAAAIKDFLELPDQVPTVHVTWSILRTLHFDVLLPASDDEGAAVCDRSKRIADQKALPDKEDYDDGAQPSIVRKVNPDKLRAKVSDDMTAPTGKRTRDDEANNKVKVDALRKLWLNADVAAFFQVSGIPSPPFDEDKAKKAVEGYIDYFEGRMIKADFSKFVEGDASIFEMYDHVFGKGKAKEVLGW